MKLYAIKNFEGELLVNWFCEPWITSDESTALHDAKVRGYTAVEIKIEIIRDCTPKRLAKIARKELKSMAAKPKKAVKKVTKKSGKK